jgi:uncharacterized damage-inducible protein DinB
MKKPLPIETLFRYQSATIQRLLDQAAKLSNEQYYAHPGYGHGSLHDIFFHLLQATRSWRIALETGKQQAGIKAADYAALELIRIAYTEEYAAWYSLLAPLTDEQLYEPLSLMNWRGEPWTLIRWRVLQQIVLHSMQHHAELAQLLSIYGQSPGNIDFIFYPGE